MKIRPGNFVNIDENGKRTVTNAPIKRVLWIECRRAADFGKKWGLEIPPTAARTTCHTCKAPIIFNPNDERARAMVAAGAVRRCLQCADIEPLPAED